MKTTRLHKLDYLRGLAAFGIMAYHFAGWAYGELSTELFIKRLGTYGVSVFYVLSGLTLFHVYSQNMRYTKDDLLDFFVKRGFRILPLLAVATLATVAAKLMLGGAWPSIEKLLLNLTGLFGLVAPGSYIAVGAWSIGNELVFYLFFPLFIFLYQKSKTLLALLSVGVFSVYCYYAFGLLAGYGSLDKHGWEMYIHPLNQLFLFLSGFLVGVFLQHKRYSNTFMLTLLFVSLAAFVFYPVSGNPINLVTGTTRIVFTIACITLCVCAYKMEFELPSLADKPLRILGEISYSLYLLHPFTWKVADETLMKYFRVPLPLFILVAIILSLVCSYISYEYFEKYFVRKGRQVLSKLIPNHTAKSSMKVLR